MQLASLALALGFLALGTDAQAPAGVRDRRPVRARVTPILGTQRTLQPSVSIANLDAGDLVAGRTWWEMQGVFYVETFVGFLWTPGGGMAPFAVSPTLYFTNHFQSPADIADDGTVVGTLTLRRAFGSFPIHWRPDGGFAFLPVPGASGAGQGGALATSRDASSYAGWVSDDFFALPRAARWVQGALEELGPRGSYSMALASSDDGRTLVGELGATRATAQATRWIDGVEVPLAAVPGATWSSARFLSDDGTTAVGLATLGAGDALVSWDAAGLPTVHAAPLGYTVAELNAITPDASAAAGALIRNDDQVPFRWRATDGFTRLGELGLGSTYDRSTARDLSDDGARVVGTLTSKVFGPGSPKQKAFLWTARAGTRWIDDVLSAAGQPPLGTFDANAISGDGRRFLATGIVRPTLNDTSTVLIELLGP